MVKRVIIELDDSKTYTAEGMTIAGVEISMSPIMFDIRRQMLDPPMMISDGQYVTIKLTLKGYYSNGYLTQCKELPLRTKELPE